MSSKEQAVRDAAEKLRQTIIEARAEGLVVTWPHSVEGLATMPVSAGRKALTPDEIGAAAKAAAEREQAARRPAAVPGAEYDSMHKSSLVELAQGRGIDLPSGATKAEIIDLLKASPAPAI